MIIHPGQFTLYQLRTLHVTTTVSLDPAGLPGICASAARVKKAAQGGAAAYGVNTGFGKLAKQAYPMSDSLLIRPDEVLPPTEK